MRLMPTTTKSKNCNTDEMAVLMRTSHSTLTILLSCSTSLNRCQTWVWLEPLLSRQLENAQGFVHFTYNHLEMFGKVMEFMLPSGSAICANGQRLFMVAPESSHADESVLTLMDLVGSVPYSTCSSSEL
jgi:hypothetical protein